MCKPMSGYAAIVQDVPTLWVSEKTDSHSEIAVEFNLRDDGKHELYAFEFNPDEANPTAEPATWTLCWDSDATASMREKPCIEFTHRIRPLIEKMAKKYIFSSGKHKVDGICRAWVFETAHVEARGSSRVEAWGSSRVVAWDSSHVVARGSSSVEAWGNSTTNSYGPKPKAIRKNAVWIDRTGNKPVVILSGGEFDPTKRG